MSETSADVAGAGRVRLADLTTLRLGGPPRRLVTARTEDELVAAVAEADAAATPLLLVAGGSNLVVADDGFAGTVVLVRTRGVDAEVDADGAGVTVTAAAGEHWEALVAQAVESGWSGVEALSGIPGSVGATPVQNVGAYGQEVSETVVRVRCWDRAHARLRTLAAHECGFGYRSSRFKSDPDRFVVLAVTLRLRPQSMGSPVRYGELARSLALREGECAPAARVREAVLGLRAGKGMVLDPADHDTWSAGSFFTNPLLPGTRARELPEPAPRWPQPDGSVKTSAAWLIEHAGFARGHGNDRVRLSSKHPLALTNRGGATTRDLLALAGEVRVGVDERFGVRLVNEPTLVGCSLPG